jgi:hypothetical protein
MLQTVRFAAVIVDTTIEKVSSALKNSIKANVSQYAFFPNGPSVFREACIVDRSNDGRIFCLPMILPVLLNLP